MNRAALTAAAASAAAGLLLLVLTVPGLLGHAGSLLVALCLTAALIGAGTVALGVGLAVAAWALCCLIDGISANHQAGLRRLQQQRARDDNADQPARTLGGSW